MLVLTRQVNKVVVVVLPDGRTVDVMVTDLRPDRVNLGFTADRDIRIYRKEVWELINAESAGMCNVGDGTGVEGVQGAVDTGDVSGPGDTRPADMHGRQGEAADMAQHPE